MSSKKRLGYNWRARQQKAQSNVGGERVVPEVEGFLDTDRRYHVSGERDSNALVLPSKRKRTGSGDTEQAPKRKKLSTRQKKRLQKIVEAKERKAQVCSN